MLSILKRCTLPLFLFIAATAFAYPRAGQEAPDFSSVDINGKEQSLKQYKGKIVILEWTNPECPHVRKHYVGSKNIPNMQKEFTKNPNIIWLLICSSAPGKEGHKTPDEWKELLTKFDASPTSVLIDDSGAIAKLYGVTRTPEFIIIGSDGTIEYRGAVDTIPSADPEDIQNPINRELIRESINNLLKGNPIYTTETIPYGCPIRS